MSKNKIPISEAKIRGGLKDLEQIYRINYMPKEDQYEDKIEVAITLEKQGLQEGAYRSLRFTNPVQLKGFIMSLIKSYVLFSRQRKMIHIKNFNYHLKEFLLGVEKIFRGN